MDDAAVVGVIQRLGDRRHDLYDSIGWDAVGVFVAQQAGGVGADHVLEDYPHARVVLAAVTHPEDVWMVQRRGQVGRSREAFAEFGIGCPLGWKCPEHVGPR